jgi:MFS family permease
LEIVNLKISSHVAYAAIITMGVVSLLGDVIYEGGRSLIPEYLEFLGASAILVGTVSGIGDFIGYALRLFSGSFADRTRAYWAFIFIGYGLVVAVPLLGLAPAYTIAIIFVILERVGKAWRSPSRDAVISILSKDIGAGKAFGLHEFLDQTGAVIGPLLVAAVMFYSSNNYSSTFLVLFIPFGLMLVALSYAYKKVGKITQPQLVDSGERSKKLPKHFYIYSAAIGLSTLGLLPVSLILYTGASIVSPSEQWLIPVLYAVIQAIDAPLNLISGLAFDRVGIKMLVLPLAVSFLPMFFISYGSLTGVVLACVAYSIVLGMQESVYRAAVSAMIPPRIRSTAYGIFNTFLGLGILAAGPIFGFFIESHLIILPLAFVAVTQAIAISLLLQSIKHTRETATL